jgi:hypothetical protein
MFKPILIKTTLAIAAALSLIASSLPSSIAQTLGPNITASFVAEDVQVKQGKISIDPDSHTILRFFDEVTFAFSRRSDLLKAVPKGNDVLLYAMTDKTDTDLSVLVDGKWHFFAVKIVKGAGLHFYEIKQRERPTSPASLPNSSPANPSTANSSPVNPSTSSEVQSPNLEPTTNEPGPAASLVSPNWLTWKVARFSTTGDEVKLAYTLENHGEKKIGVSDQRLRVLRDGEPLEFRIERPGGQSLLNPGEAQSGFIRVKAEPGSFKLQWSVREIGSENVYVVEAVIP